MDDYKVLVTHTAKKEIDYIITYLSEEMFSPDIAKLYLAEIRRAINSLAMMPKRFTLIFDEELTPLGYRKLMVKNYIIFFTVNDEENTVYIQRVHYNRRDWAKLF